MMQTLKTKKVGKGGRLDISYFEKKEKKMSNKENGGVIELTRYQERIKTTGQSFCGAGAAASIPWAAGVKG